MTEWVAIFRESGCKFFLTAEGCKFGDECHYKHPRTTGKCLHCGADGHSLSTCTRPSKSKSGGQPKQMAKGEGRSTTNPTSSQPSPSAKPKAQPKKKSGKGGGKGKKGKPSVKSSAKSSAKAGEVSFDDDDVEEEDPEAEYDWDEEDNDVAVSLRRSTRILLLSAPLRQLTTLMTVKFVARMITTMIQPWDPATTREFQERAFEEEHWTTDEDAIDSAGPTRVPNTDFLGNSWFQRLFFTNEGTLTRD